MDRAMSATVYSISTPPPTNRTPQTYTRQHSWCKITEADVCRHITAKTLAVQEI